MRQPRQLPPPSDRARGRVQDSPTTLRRIRPKAPPSKDHRAFFEEIAAVNLVARMRAPLLLVHAKHDIRVPIEETYQLLAALSGLGREPSLLVFDDDGHHFDRVENRVRFATEGVAFLVASIDSI